MRLTGSISVLACKNIDTALEFYQHALQFVVVKQRKSEHRLEWVYLRSGEVSLMLELVAMESADKQCAGRIYLYSDDVKQLHHFLKARGHEVTELRLTPYDMQEFDISDPEGHRLTIGQRVTEKSSISV